MTHRTDANPPTAIEKATTDTVESIRHNAHHFHHEHNLANPAKGFACTEEAFLRILALYLHDKSLADWANDLGIPDPSDPSERQRT
jgi:hypothetical protein